MAGLFDLHEHLVFYKSYHMHPKNVAIHLFCIPLILFSGAAMLIPVVPINDYPNLNLGKVFIWGYGIYYTLLDISVGLPTLMAFAGIEFGLEKIYSQAVVSSLTSEYIRYAAIIHVCAWLAQFYGHIHHERRAPALLDNLLQALVLAPFFVAFEIAFMMGFKLDVERDITNKAGKNVLAFRKAQHHHT